MMLPVIPILGLAGKILDKLFPNPTERAEAEAKLQQLALDGELKKVELQLSAIVMEAQSTDKWTSRARPGFMYVIYIFLLSAIPMGFISAIDPSFAVSITQGVTAWLQALPEAMWGLFGAGYLGYTGARTMEKRKLIEKVKQDA